MDFLNQAFAQVKDLYQGMTPGSRITASLLLVAVVVSLGFLFTGTVSPGESYLFDNQAFTTTETQRMAAAFGQAGLDNFEFPQGKVRVPRAQRSEYLAALAQYDALPDNFGDHFLDAFASASFWDSSRRDQQRIKTATEKTLSDLISAFDGVEVAQVKFDSHEGRGLAAEELITAAVSVQPRGSCLDEKWVAPITGLMIKSIAGLKPENVVVTDRRSGAHFLGDQEGGFGGAGGNYAHQLRTYKEFYEKELRRLLSVYPGATVAVNVDLSPESSMTVEETELNPETVTVQTSETMSSRISERQGRSGSPGYLAQQNNSPMAIGNNPIKGDREEDTVEESTLTSLPSGKTTKSEYAGHTPKDIRVSVVVPQSYVERIWHEQNPATGEDEPVTPKPVDLQPIETQISNQITALVSNYVNSNPTDSMSRPVAVEFVHDFKPEPIAEPGWVGVGVDWLTMNWTTLGLFGLALVSVVMLRSMIRSNVVTEADRAEFAPVGGDVGEQEAAVLETTNELRREAASFNRGEGSLRDEVSELVAQDPDTAASVLRNWIGPVSASK